MEKRNCFGTLTPDFRVYLVKAAVKINNLEREVKLAIIEKYKKNMNFFQDRK